MYILIELITNGVSINGIVSRKKKNIEEYLKKRGYHYSKVYNLWINDDECSDYRIEIIREI